MATKSNPTALADRLRKLAHEYGGHHSQVGRELSLLALRARLLGTDDRARYARSTGPLPRIMRVDRERTMCPECAQLHGDFEWSRHAVEVFDSGECHIPYYIEELIESWSGACEFCGDSDEVTHIVSTLTRYIAR